MYQYDKGSSNNYENNIYRITAVASLANGQFKINELYVFMRQIFEFFN